MKTPVRMMCSLILLALFIGHGQAAAQDSKNTSSAEAKSPTPALNLKESLEKTLLAERQNYQQLAEQLQNLLFFGKDIEVEINAYKVESSAYNSLLLVSTNSVEELEKAHGNTKSTLDHISARLKELQRQAEDFEQLRVKTEEQYALNQKQLDENAGNDVKGMGAETEIKEVLEQLQALTGILSEKRDVLSKLLAVHAGLISRLQDIQLVFITLSEQFAHRIEERKKQELFERKTNPLSALSWAQVTLESAQFIDQIFLLLSRHFWLETFRTLWQAESFPLLRFVLFFVTSILFLLRLRAAVTFFLRKISFELHPWRHLTVRMIHKSLVLSGIAAFFFVYAQIRPLFSSVPIAEVCMQMFMILLFTHWLLSFFKYWGQKRGDTNPNRLVFHTRLLILLVRYFVLAYVVLLWALGSSSVLLLFARVLFEIALIAWSAPFWRVFRGTPFQIFPGGLETRKTLRATTISLGYIVALTGLLLELSGYGLLAQYWFFSWGKTSVVILWGLIFFHVLREWEHGAKKQDLPEQESAKKYRSTGWFIARICWIVWPIFLIAGILVAWGAKQYMLLVMLELLSYPVTIGGVDVRLLGVIYAILLLLLTDVATRLWRHILRKKILANSGMAIGLQISIATISNYVIWFVGLLWALRTIGIGTTSLAVVFGALGIGLGFGLQGIFNNFVSGLILLFERPIEVGNIIEVNGTWGCVEKIHVRATVVRTYDNSALIIPNSDIVSNQLTNWTFRDARMRRTIQVGVAYGSDVKRVEQTLYEIAQNHPRVMVDPEPMVLFSDFGDSALIFKLRVWTLIDYGLTTETEIRFDIDRIFREKKLTIAFPQLDVHVYPEGGAGQLQTEGDVFS